MKLRRTDELIEQAFERCARLPALAGEAIAAAMDEEKSVDDLATLVGTDQALSARLMRLANSPSLGRPMRVNDLRTAALLVGLDGLRGLLLGSVMNLVTPGGQDTYTMLLRLQDHAAACAALAKSLAPKVAGVFPGEVAAAALMHDLGLLIMLDTDAALLEKLGATCSEADSERLAAERATFGFTHEELGARIASEWYLPSTLSATLGHHHHPLSLDLPEEDRALVRLVGLSDGLTYTVGFGAFSLPQARTDSELLQKSLALTNEQIEAAVRELPEKATLWRSVLMNKEPVQPLQEKAVRNLWQISLDLLQRANASQQSVELLSVLAERWPPSGPGAEPARSDALEQVLGPLAITAQCDHLGLYLADARGCRPLCSWTAPGTTVTSEEFGRALREGLSGEPLVTNPLPSVADRPWLVLAEECASGTKLIFTARGEAAGLPLFPRQSALLSSFADLFGVMMQKELSAERARQATEFGVGLLEAASEALLVLDGKGRLVYTNRAATKALGLSVAPGDEPQAARELLKALGLAANHLELIDECASLGCDLDQLVDIPGQSEGSRTFHLLGSRLPLATGASGYRLCFYDITELRQMHDRLVETERKSLLFDTSVALNHELNTPLCGILMALDLLSSKLEGTMPEALEEIDTVREMAERCTDVLARLRGMEEPHRTEYIDGTYMLNLEKTSHAK